MGCSSSAPQKNFEPPAQSKSSASRNVGTSKSEACSIHKLRDSDGSTNRGETSLPCAVEPASPTEASPVAGKGASRILANEGLPAAKTAAAAAANLVDPTGKSNGALIGTSRSKELAPLPLRPENNDNGSGSLLGSAKKNSTLTLLSSSSAPPAMPLTPRKVAIAPSATVGGTPLERALADVVQPMGIMDQTSISGVASNSGEYTPTAAAATAAKPLEKSIVDPSDPWASLQQQYKIQEDADWRASESKSSLLYPSLLRDLSRSRGLPGGGSFELVVVTDDGDDFLDGLANPGQRNSRRSGVGPSLAPVPRKGPPRKGQWGSGDMASAGTLMVGHDYLQPGQERGGFPSGGKGVYEKDRRTSTEDLDEDLAPTSSARDRAKPGQQLPGAADSRALARKNDDIVFEDVDDFDADAGDGGMNVGLASKLRQFEMMDEATEDER